MPSNTVFLSFNTAVIAIECAVALFVVYRKLSRVPHALLWSVSFAALAMQWLTLALSGGRGAFGPTAQLFGLISLLLFVESFRVRARGGWPKAHRMIIAAAVMVVAISSDLALPALDRHRMVAVLSAGLFAYAATLVVPSGRRASAPEIAAIILLTTMAVVRLIPLALDGGSLQLIEWMRQGSATPLPAAAGLIVMLLIASDLSSELGRMLVTDPLTGLLNRAGFEKAARSALRRARSRARAPISVAIADIDNFKMINDAHGHSVGDATLACVASHLAGARAGREDLVGRIGGEEFAILLWGTNGTTALTRIEPVRAGLAAACVNDELETAVTASFGIAERRAGEDLATLLDRADRALYRSKRAGRDRTTLADGGE